MAGISTVFYSSMSYQTNFEPMVFLSFSMVFLWFPMVLRGPLRVPVSRQDSVATRQSTGHGSLGSGGRLDFPSIQKGGDGVGHGNSSNSDDDHDDDDDPPPPPHHHGQQGYFESTTAIHLTS